MKQNICTVLMSVRYLSFDGGMYPQSSRVMRQRMTTELDHDKPFSLLGSENYA